MLSFYSAYPHTPQAQLKRELCLRIPCFPAHLSVLLEQLTLKWSKIKMPYTEFKDKLAGKKKKTTQNQTLSCTRKERGPIPHPLDSAEYLIIQYKDVPYHAFSGFKVCNVSFPCLHWQTAARACWTPAPLLPFNVWGNEQLHVAWCLGILQAGGSVRGSMETGWLWGALLFLVPSVNPSVTKKPQLCSLLGNTNAPYSSWTCMTYGPFWTITMIWHMTNVNKEIGWHYHSLSEDYFICDPSWKSLRLWTFWRSIHQPVECFASISFNCHGLFKCQHWKFFCTEI